MRDHESELVNYQWGSGALLNDSLYYIQGITPVYDGISTTEFSGLYNSFPEYGIYL